MKMRGSGVNVWLLGNTRVFLDVMLGRSHGSMLQNDLVLIRARVGVNRKQRVQKKCGHTSVIWTVSLVLFKKRKRKDQEGKTD